MIGKWISNLMKQFDQLLTQMDMTQWAIVSVIFVVIGFMALRTKL